MRFDVAIVGAGPAGTSTALHLLAQRPALAGRIVLVEKHAHPREKYCAGAVSAWGLDVLARLGLDALAVGVPIRSLAVRLGHRVGRVTREGLGLVVRRSVFDAALADAARTRGAVIRDHTAVRTIERDGTAGFVLRTGAGEDVRARVVVGADGAGGTTRRALGLGEPTRRAHLYLAETLQPEARDAVREGTLLFDMAPAVQDGLEGYYWDFAAPLDGPSPGTSRGVFHLNRRAPRADALKRSLAQGLAVRGIAIDSVALKPHSIRPYARGAALAVPGALLVGEAAGVDPLSGEGIAHALSMGELAGETIARALDDGDLGFTGWTHRVADAFVGRHLRQACALADVVYGPRVALWARLLVDSPTALDLAARWYRGERVSRADALSLLAKLPWDLARSATRRHAVEHQREVGRQGRLDA